MSSTEEKSPGGKARTRLDTADVAPAMPVKESSDEFNPTLLTAEPVSRPTAKRLPGDYAALAFSTWGVGFSPIAPGTLGSAIGVGIYLISSLGYDRWLAPAASNSFDPIRIALLLAITGIIAVIGTWAATRTERLLQRKDPGAVVVDEVAGQMLALLFLPAQFSWWMILIAFLAFRAFDIWKPYPARRLEMLESGLGIMADDIVAGAYAAVLVALVIAGRAFF